MNPSVLKALAILALVCVSLTVGGCRTTRPGPRNIEFRKTKDLGEIVAVDIVGVSKEDIKTWRGLDTATYFNRENHPLRKAASDSGFLLRNAADWHPGQSMNLSRKDPRWKDWLSRGVHYVVILADLDRSTLQGGADTRRNEVDLADRATRKKKIVAEISPGQVSVRTEKK